MIRGGWVDEGGGVEGEGGETERRDREREYPEE